MGQSDILTGGILDNPKVSSRIAENRYSAAGAPFGPRRTKRNISICVDRAYNRRSCRLAVFYVDQQYVRICIIGGGWRAPRREISYNEHIHFVVVRTIIGGGDGYRVITGKEGPACLIGGIPTGSHIHVLAQRNHTRITAIGGVKFRKAINGGSHLARGGRTVIFHMYVDNSFAERRQGSSIVDGTIVDDPNGHTVQIRA